MVNKPLPEKFYPYEISLTEMAKWWGLAFEMSVFGYFYRVGVELMSASTTKREEL